MHVVTASRTRCVVRMVLIATYVLDERTVHLHVDRTAGATNQPGRGSNAGPFVTDKALEHGVSADDDELRWLPTVAQLAWWITAAPFALWLVTVDLANLWDDIYFIP